MNIFTKGLLGILFAAATLPAYGMKAVVSCVTELPTTSYFLEQNDEGYKLTIYHHNGTDYMIVYDSPVTPADLPMIEERAKEMKKLGDRVSFQFPKENCTNNGMYWRCYRGKPLQIGEANVTLGGFAMGRLEGNYEGVKWVSTEVFFHLDLNGKNVTLQQSFPEGSCFAP